MSKVDAADVEEVSAWMKSILQKDIPEFPDGWKDGVILCELANALKPGIIKKINRSKLPFHKMENIENFTNAARKMGVEDRYNFVTVDLTEDKNHNAVLRCLINLKRDLGFGFNQGHAQTDHAVFDKIQDNN